MRFLTRMYRDEDDYWRLRAFLREVYLINDRQEFSWQVARLDYWRFFGNECLEHYALSDAICMVETADGTLVGFVTPESRANAYLNIHPAFQARTVIEPLVEAAETCLAELTESGKPQVTMWAQQWDRLTNQILKERGYERGDWPEYQRRRSLDQPLPYTPLTFGYTIRSLGDATELPARAWLSWQVFHPDEPDENYGGWEWYFDIQRCPLYRRDLDLVAVAPDGELAAFCTVWYDDVTRTGYFEPVGVHYTHQRKGLGKAIMNEGLRRLKHIGATQATVAGYSEAANALYSSVMSPDYLLLERWHKTL